MGETVCETIDALLGSVEAAVEDQELVYRLRTARQLAIVCDHQNQTLAQAVDDADVDRDVRDTLRKFGYLE